MWILKVIVLIFIFLLTICITATAYYGQTLLFNHNSLVHHECDITFDEFNENGINGRYYNNFPDRRTILVCHGNNDNITERKYLVDICDKYKLNLLLFDYQGFGKSVGTPYQYSLQPDSQTAYNYLIKKKVKQEDIIIWGESLGGNPATYLSEMNKSSALVLVSTFSSMEECLTDYNSYFWKYSAKVLKQVFDNSDTISRLKNVKVPVIIVHSRDDELIPFKSAERLFQSIPHQGKKLVEITGTHSNPMIDAKILDRIMRHLSDSDMNINECPDFSVSPHKGKKINLQ